LVEIERKNEELNKSNATKDKFFGIIAHDLKNPIGTIWGFSDLLIEDELIIDEDKKDVVKGINQCAEHTHKLLEDLLSWARAQKDSIEFAPKEHEIFAIVDKELKVLQQVADKKQIEIKNHIPVEHKMYADQPMFETIIRNLVSNAIKYTNAGGMVSIKAQPMVKNQQPFMQFSIADNGIGMTQEVVASLFAITKNKSTRGTDNEEGTGLGLLLIKEFIDKHQGNIYAESQPGAGSTFTFELPLLKSSAKKPTQFANKIGVE
jgi:signal transduction histidine kinase